MKKCCLFVLALFSVLFPSDPVLFILDASGSMWGRLDGIEKIVAAKSVLVEMVNTMDDDIALGLMAYGHRYKGDCNDIELLIAPQTHTQKDLIQAIQTINPKGKTPIQHSLQAAADLATAAPLEIILISDGKENCDSNPCDFVKKLRQHNVHITIHIVGFDVSAEEKSELLCLAQAGGGEYYSANSAHELCTALQHITVDILSQSPEKGSLLVTGKGNDLYSVFSADGKDKVTTAATNTSVELEPGIYRVELGRVFQNIQVTAGKETKVCSGHVMVQGLGQELYAVFDITGQQKFNFTRTNKMIEVLSGAYLVEMNGTRRTVIVECDSATVLKASAVQVTGSSENLYAIFDPTGTHKYQFTRVNKPIEVLPGFYSIQIGDRWIYDVELKEGAVLEIAE